MTTNATRNKEQLGPVPKMAPPAPALEGEDVVPIYIGKMEYVWSGKPGRHHPEIVGWYNEFEELLRAETFTAIPQAHTQYSRRMQNSLWTSVKVIYVDMLNEADGRCIIEGMRDPLRMISVPSGIYLPRQGNQRLCVLRSQDYHKADCSCHGGLVPCVILPR